MRVLWPALSRVLLTYYLLIYFYFILYFTLLFKISVLKATIKYKIISESGAWRSRPVFPQNQRLLKQATVMSGKPLMSENAKSLAARLMTYMFDGVLSDTVLATQVHCQICFIDRRFRPQHVYRNTYRQQIILTHLPLFIGVLFDSLQLER